jgi:hypothetical protein
MDRSKTTKQDVPVSDEMAYELVKTLMARNEADKLVYEQNVAERDKIIALLQGSCEHVYMWMNDPYYESLHECRKCGKESIE